jgi:hypothetical protein
MMAAHVSISLIFIGCAGASVSRDVLDKYRKEYRYKQSPETLAIVNAKHQ